MSGVVEKLVQFNAGEERSCGGGAWGGSVACVERLGGVSPGVENVLNEVSACDLRMKGQTNCWWGKRKLTSRN